MDWQPGRGWVDGAQERALLLDQQRGDDVERFVLIVQSGEDKPLPVSWGSVKEVLPSEYLGECSPKEAKALLLKACCAALKNSPEEAASLLRSFVEQVAEGYADDCN